MKINGVNGVDQNGVDHGKSVLHCATIFTIETLVDDLNNQDFDIRIDDLIWDDWNLNHIKKHDVTKEVVELLIMDKYVHFMDTYGGRIIALGRSNKCLVLN